MATDKIKKDAGEKKVKKSEPKKTEQVVASSNSEQNSSQMEVKKHSSAAKPSKSESATKSKMPSITIKQIGSPIRRDPRQEIYLKSLGLGKMNRVRQVVDSPATRGLLNKLRHMVVVVEQ